MQRKLVRLGSTSTVVTLPREWVQSHGLEAGSDVEVTQLPDRVEVRPLGARISHEATVDLRGVDRMMGRLVATAYLQGAPQITILIDSSVQRRTVLARADKLIGMEVLSQDESCVRLVSIEGETAPFPSTIRRLLHVIAQLRQQCTQQARDETYIMELEEQANRLTEYAQRTLHRSAEVGVTHKPAWYAALLLIENIGDAFKRLPAHATPESLETFLDAAHEAMRDPRIEAVLQAARAYDALEDETLQEAQQDLARLHMQAINELQIAGSLEPR